MIHNLKGSFCSRVQHTLTAQKTGTNARNFQKDVEEKLANLNSISDAAHLFNELAATIQNYQTIRHADSRSYEYLYFLYFSVLDKIYLSSPDYGNHNSDVCKSVLELNAEFLTICQKNNLNIGSFLKSNIDFNYEKAGITIKRHHDDKFVFHYLDSERFVAFIASIKARATYSGIACTYSDPATGKTTIKSTIPVDIDDDFRLLLNKITFLDIFVKCRKHKEWKVGILFNGLFEKNITAMDIFNRAKSIYSLLVDDGCGKSDMIFKKNGKHLEFYFFGTLIAKAKMDTSEAVSFAQYASSCAHAKTHTNGLLSDGAGQNEISFNLSDMELVFSDREYKTPEEKKARKNAAWRWANSPPSTNVYKNNTNGGDHKNKEILNAIGLTKFKEDYQDGYDMEAKVSAKLSQPDNMHLKDYLGVQKIVTGIDKKIAEYKLYKYTTPKTMESFLLSIDDVGKFYTAQAQSDHSESGSTTSSETHGYGRKLLHEFILSIRAMDEIGVEHSHINVDLKDVLVFEKNNVIKVKIIDFYQAKDISRSPSTNFRRTQTDQDLAEEYGLATPNVVSPLSIWFSRYFDVLIARATSPDKDAIEGHADDRCEHVPAPTGSGATSLSNHFTTKLSEYGNTLANQLKKCAQDRAACNAAYAVYSKQVDKLFIQCENIVRRHITDNTPVTPVTPGEKIQDARIENASHYDSLLVNLSRDFDRTEAEKQITPKELAFLYSEKVQQGSTESAPEIEDVRNQGDLIWTRIRPSSEYRRSDNDPLGAGTTTSR